MLEARKAPSAQLPTLRTRPRTTQPLVDQRSRCDSSTGPLTKPALNYSRPNTRPYLGCEAAHWPQPSQPGGSLVQLHMCMNFHSRRTPNEAEFKIILSPNEVESSKSIILSRGGTPHLEQIHLETVLRLSFLTRESCKSR